MCAPERVLFHGGPSDGRKATWQAQGHLAGAGAAGGLVPLLSHVATEGARRCGRRET